MDKRASERDVTKVWAFPSSHGATVYEAIMRQDGTISCDCPMVY